MSTLVNQVGETIEQDHLRLTLVQDWKYIDQAFPINWEKTPEQVDIVMAQIGAWIKKFYWI